MSKNVLTSDPKTLAKALVAERLAIMADDAVFFSGDGGPDPHTDERFSGIVLAYLLEHSDWSAVEIGQQEAKAREAFLDMLDAYQNVGFLVGLELGRRLGGAR